MEWLDAIPGWVWRTGAAIGLIIATFLAFVGLLTFISMELMRRDYER